MKLKPETKFRPEGDSNPLVNVPVDGEEIRVTIRNIIHLNCGERYEDMIDHRSYLHNLIKQLFKLGKKKQA